MDKRKFNRVPEDKSQFEKFVDETIDGLNAGGGTQLYKHVLVCTMGKDGDWEEPQDCTITIINTSEAGLKNVNPNEWMITNNYVSGMFKYADPSSDNFERSAPILLISDVGEPYLYFMGLDSYEPTSAYFTGYAKSEEVIPL